MNKNLIIGIVAAVVVVSGGVAYTMTNKDEAKDSSSNNNNSSQEDNNSDGGTKFSPANTLEKDFVATLKSEGEDTDTDVAVKYDVDGKIWAITSKYSGQTAEMIITEDTYYSKIAGDWTKLPYDSEQGTGFDQGAYELSDEEIASFQENLDYKGEASCPAGTCDLWEAENYQGNDKLSFYVNKSDNTINQLVTESSGVKTTITYAYEDVTIEIPANAKEIPAL